MKIDLKIFFSRFIWWPWCLIVGHRYSVMDKLHCQETTLGCRRCTYRKTIPVDWRNVGRITTQLGVDAPYVALRVLEDGDPLFTIQYTKKEAIQQGRMILSEANKLKKMKVNSSPVVQ